MRTKTIAFLNIKGGVAKTASVTSIAHMMVTLHQKKVLIVDLDAQANATSMYCPMDDNYEERIKRILNNDVYAIENSISTLMSDANMDIHDCIRKTEYENLDIIPADLTLTTVENMLKADTMMPQQFRLKKHLDNIDGEYDYILLDCSPSVGLININGLAAAEEVYVPIRADGNSIEGFALAKNLTETVSSYNPKLKLAGCYFVAWENNISARYLYELLEENMSEVLIPIKITKSKFLAKNTIFQKPLYAIDHGKNKSRATLNYMELTEYIIAEDKKAYLETIMM